MLLYADERIFSRISGVKVNGIDDYFSYFFQFYVFGQRIEFNYDFDDV